MSINWNVLREAYGWTLSVEGEVMGLVAGDMGYEETGIFIDGGRKEFEETWTGRLDVAMEARRLARENPTMTLEQFADRYADAETCERVARREAADK